MIGFKFDRAEYWLNKETIVRSQSYGDKITLSVRGGGVGREGLLKILGGG